MKAHVERCSGITVKSIETINTSSWSKRKHKELKSASLLDAQSLFNMKDNYSIGMQERSKKTVQS